MAPELGKIEKLPADNYKEGRKLYFAPLLFTPLNPPDDLLKLVDTYWKQVESQIGKLETTLGKVAKIYHEIIPDGGDQGLQAIKEINSHSFQIVSARAEKGAELQPLEDGELLTEFMDWSRCLAIGLLSPKVFGKIYESFTDAQKRRNSHLVKRIDETLQKEETGMLLMHEEHQLQFPPDIQVFYVAPPSLDEIKRWLRTRQAEAKPKAEKEEQQETEQKD